MVKWRSRHGPNEESRVRILVGVATAARAAGRRDGVRGVTGARESVDLEEPGSTPAGHPGRIVEALAMSADVLCRGTLVLNRHWQPIHVTTVVRALVQLWNEAA